MKLITITFSPCADDKVPFSYRENAFISWVDEVFQEGYKKPEGASFSSLEECLSLITGVGYRFQVEEACYVYTCDATADLQVTEVTEENFAQLCADCRILWEEHDAACKIIGIDPWDETFVVFRAGALAERARRAKPKTVDILTWLNGRAVEIEVYHKGAKQTLWDPKDDITIEDATALFCREKGIDMRREAGIEENGPVLRQVFCMPVDHEADARAEKHEARLRSLNEGRTKAGITLKKLPSKSEKLLQRIAEVVEPSKLEEEEENYDWNRADLLGILHDIRAILFGDTTISKKIGAE